MNALPPAVLLLACTSLLFAVEQPPPPALALLMEANKHLAAGRMSAATPLLEKVPNAPAVLPHKNRRRRNGSLKSGGATAGLRPATRKPRARD